MTDKPVRIPGPDHPIAITPQGGRVIVSVDGRVIADTRDALTLQESTYPAVQYIPRKDVDMAALARTDYATYCPYKGDAAYYSVQIGEKSAVNAVWSYEQPFPAMEAITGHVAFYPNRIDAIEQS